MLLPQVAPPLRWFERVEPHASRAGRARDCRRSLVLHWLAFGGQRLTVLEREGPSELKYTVFQLKPLLWGTSGGHLGRLIAVAWVDLGVALVD